MEIRPKYSEEELDTIFAKATPVVEGLSKDEAGQLINRSAYADSKHPWGWEVDHIKAIKDGGTNELSNLRPLNISTNRGRNN